MQIVQIALASEVKQSLDALKTRARELHAEVEAEIFRRMQEVIIRVPSDLPAPVLGRPKLPRLELSKDQINSINAAIMKHGVDHPKVVKLRELCQQQLESKIKEEQEEQARRKALRSPAAKAKQKREIQAKQREAVLEEDPTLALKLEAVTRQLTNSSIAADALLLGVATLRKELEDLFGSPKGFTKKSAKK